MWLSHTSGLGKPERYSLSPWDNGARGNYWSQYTGSDINGNGIGDVPYEIPTNRETNMPYSYTFIDRYPIVSPLNIDAETSQIPLTIPSQTPLPNSSSKDQATALLFLKNVPQLDVNKYIVTLGYSTASAPNDYPADYLGYGFVYWNNGVERTANASFTISNNAVTAFSLESTGGQLFTAYEISNSFDTATKFMQNYQTWTNDPDINKMITLLNRIGSEKNATEQTGNINLKIMVTNFYTTFSWSYNYNEVDYSGVTLSLSDFPGFSSISFTDNRGIYKIGNTNIEISKQQATNTAVNFVRNYHYAINFGNATIATIKDLNINETSIQANLLATSRNQITLYPYWRVQVPLDHTYPEKTYAVTVDVWADTGAVFNAQRQVAPTILTVPQYSYDPTTLIQMLEITAIAMITVLLAILGVAIWVLRSYGKKKSPT